MSHTVIQCTYSAFNPSLWGGCGGQPQTLLDWESGLLHPSHVMEDFLLEVPFLKGHFSLFAVT